MLSTPILSLSQLALFLFSQEMSGAKTLHFSRLPKVHLITFQRTPSETRKIAIAPHFVSLPEMPSEPLDSLSSRKKPDWPNQCTLLLLGSVTIAVPSAHINQHKSHEYGLDYDLGHIGSMFLWNGSLPVSIGIFCFLPRLKIITILNIE